MTKKKMGRPITGRTKKVKRSHYFDADLWERLQAFARSHDPVVTDSAVIESALRRYLDAEEKKK